ncbi:site-specific integrase [Arenibacter latericius]|uniref:site-specific integrase n=1 Tax=Arenibacter latericius TaxID=86104 RepID=UPI0003F6D42E|nr:site-specific integrase [Arenibacter latericius]
MLTTKVLLNKVRQKQDGTFPLVIRVTYNRKSIYLPLGYNMVEKDFDPKNQRIRPSSKIASNITRLNYSIQDKLKKVYDTVTRLEEEGKIESYSMPLLKREIEGKPVSNMDFYSFADSLIHDMRKAGKYGNAEIYKNVRNRIKKFHQKSHLPFRQINYAFIKKLETQHYAKGNTAGGLSVYLRTLRSIYKKAVKHGLAKEIHNPFNGYPIKMGTPKRQFLNAEQLETFKNALIQEPFLAKARDLYMASFYLRGMNWMDLALLKGDNIQGDYERITYIRSKTKNKLFSIKIAPALKKIMFAYAPSNIQTDDYIFPILTSTVSKYQIHETIKNKRKRENTYLKRLTERLDLPRITIYSARHTYANILKRTGAPSNVIQDSLGHTTEAMTQAYLNSFETNIIDDYDAQIMG